MENVQIVTQGLRNGCKVIWQLAKVMIPAILFVNILQATGVLGGIAGLFAPLMHFLGLPGEATVPFAIGLVTSIYGGVGAMLALPLTPRELTILSTLIAICHGAIIETTVVTKAGASGLLVFNCRFIAGILAAAAINLLW